MSTINNFEQIRGLLSFPEETSFYFLEIIKRRKENPELPKHAKLIRDYYIYSLEEFDKLRLVVEALCEENNARAYFRLNVRDSKKIALQFNKRIAELLITEDYKAIPRCYAAVVGEFHSDVDKKWLIDLDYPEEGRNLKWDATRKVIIDHINSLQPEGDKIIAEIPTKNGLHLITKPFRMDLFRGVHPDVDVHKDNPTILYQP